jgi:chromosome segregation ATPase
MSPSEYEQLLRFLGSRVDSIDQRFETIDRRFESIDRRLETIDRRFGAVESRFDAVDRRFDTLERRFDELREEMLGHFDEIYRRLERLEQSIRRSPMRSDASEARLGDERGRREILARDLAALREASRCSMRGSRTSRGAFGPRHSPANVQAGVFSR